MQPNPADSAKHDNWVVIEDQHGRLASPFWGGVAREAAEKEADRKNTQAISLGIRTRYHALPDSQVQVAQALILCRRLGTDIDWRPTDLLPEDYYVVS